ncbi:MAG TPA: 4Fe-4S binding protein [Desulfuromonadales bacterium]|nr:4Fe-4S binding protein [Desulfuromonadales bacterium]
MPLPRITSKRRLVQALLIAAALLLPFVTVAGNPFLRVDISKMTFFLAGIPVRIDQFYLVLLATLLAVAVFLLTTVVLGRVWCGWLCPQTVFNDLAELVGARFRRNFPVPVTRLVEHLTALIIAKLIAFNLLCWFMPPGQVMSSLRNFTANPLIFSVFLIMTLFGYLNLILVKRSFCHSYCPYGRIQTALMDEGTLNLAFLDATRERCLKCRACVKVCPMGIDIRNGFQIECIGCGRCIDACRSVMERLPGEVGLIDYRFGERQESRLRVGAKTIALSLLTLLLLTGLVWGVLGRNQTAFYVQRVATAETKMMADGYQVQSWRAVIGNRSQETASYSIRIAPQTVSDISLLGQTHDIQVAPNEHRTCTFFIRRKISAQSSAQIELQLVNSGASVASALLTP